MKKKDKICRKIIEFGIFGLIIFSPLPAASVYEWSILLIQSVVLVMVVAYLIMKKRPQTNDYLNQILKWPKFLFIGLFVLLLFQWVPIPVSLVKLLSPNAYSFRESFSFEVINMKFMSLSLLPTYTLKEGLELLTYFLLGFLIIRTVTQRKQIVKIYSVLIGMGIFQAFYGMFELARENPRILFYEKVYELESVTGTFVNRNHFSGYVEMIVPLALGMLVARIDLISISGLSWREKFLRLSEKGFAINSMLILGIVGMSLALIFSRSRSGVVLLFCGFLLFLALSLVFFRKTGLRKKRIMTLLQIILIIVILFTFYMGIESTFERFALDRFLHLSRTAIWMNTIDMFSKYPVFGIGLGVFSSVYPGLEAEGNPLNIFHAHNDYLEYMTELGIIGMIMLAGGIFVILFNSFIIWRKRKHPEIKGLALGGIVAIVCILLHGITDFNFHIPANMLLFSVVLSLTIVTATYKYKQQDPKIDCSDRKDHISEIIAKKEMR